MPILEDKKLEDMSDEEKFNLITYITLMMIKSESARKDSDAKSYWGLHFRRHV